MGRLEDICTNFAVARQFDGLSRVEAVRAAILELEQVRISRRNIDENLQKPLTTREAAALFTCLQKNGAAEQVSTGGSGFADYTFEISPGRVINIMTQQAAALAARSLDQDLDHPDVSFVTTLPRGFEASSVTVRRLPAIVDTIRGQVFGAESSVRIANPYFDPGLELVDDLASLPRRGVTTRILTRETGDSSGDARTSLNKMWRQIDTEHRELLEVRDLYEWDEHRGSQTFATHAKIVIVDDYVCYVGSANLTDTSLSSNFEFGVLVEGELVSDAVSVFDEIFDYASSVDFPL